MARATGVSAARSNRTLFGSPTPPKKIFWGTGFSASDETPSTVKRSQLILDFRGENVSRGTPPVTRSQLPVYVLPGTSKYHALIYQFFQFQCSKIISLIGTQFSNTVWVQERVI